MAKMRSKNSSIKKVMVETRALYLGQFVSPLVVTPASRILFGHVACRAV